MPASQTRKAAIKTYQIEINVCVESTHLTFTYYPELLPSNHHHPSDVNCHPPTSQTDLDYFSPFFFLVVSNELNISNINSTTIRYRFGIFRRRRNNKKRRPNNCRVRSTSRLFPVNVEYKCFSFFLFFLLCGCSPHYPMMMIIIL